jgi:metal-sulfur cluster biosynthetic enzyme
VLTLDIAVLDPEHPFTLEQLNVVSEEQIDATDETHDSCAVVRIEFTPTVEHCSLATLIGLCIRAKLLRTLPEYTKVEIAVSPGTHKSEHDSMLYNRATAIEMLNTPGT